MFAVDLSTDQVAATIPLPSAPDETTPITRALAMDPDGTHAYATGFAQIVDTGNLRAKLWAVDTATDTATAVTLPGRRALRGLAVSLDGGHVYATSDAGVVVVDTDALQVVATVSTQAVLGLAVHPTDPTRVFASGNGRLVEIDTTDPTQPHIVQDAAMLGQALAISPDGGHLYSAWPSGVQQRATVRVIGTEGLVVEHVLEIGSDLDSPIDLAVSPNGSQLYVTTSASGVVVIDTTSSPTVAATLGDVNTSKGVAFDAAGAFAYVAEGQGVAKIDTSTHEVAHLPVTSSLDGLATGIVPQTDRKSVV